MRAVGVLSLALALTFLLAPTATGQSVSGSATVNGHVGEAIFVSIAPDAQLSGETLPFIYSKLNPHTVRLSIHAPDNNSGVSSRRITIPLQLRSNVGYTLSASAKLGGATLRGLCVESVRATGRHVAQGAFDAARTATCKDATAGVQTRDANRSAPPLSAPAILLQGQLISLSGTNDSPFNALEVLLRLEVEPQGGTPPGSIELILSASPRSDTSDATLVPSPKSQVPSPKS
jgi:hypothetical protein